MLASLFTDIFLRVCSDRWKVVMGYYSTGFGYVSRAKLVPPLLTWFIVSLHQISNEINKMKRLLFSTHLLPDAETDVIL